MPVPSVDETYLDQFEPHRDSSGRPSEEPDRYALRMQQKLLPAWPAEVLIEWLYRHAGHLYDYAPLRFENFTFICESWSLEDIPGREAFADPKFCDDFLDVEVRATNRHDWLAIYMQNHGTWNTPILLLDTPRPEITMPGGWPLRYPYHLLEGHRRLSFLNGLRNSGKAASKHDVWVVRLSDPILDES